MRMPKYLWPDVPATSASLLFPLLHWPVSAHGGTGEGGLASLAFTLPPDAVHGDAARFKQVARAEYYWLFQACLDEVRPGLLKAILLPDYRRQTSRLSLRSLVFTK